MLEILSLVAIWVWGCKKAAEKAFQYFKFSDDNGLGYSSVWDELGLLYFYGQGCEKNENLGLSYMEKAADAGSDYAQKWLEEHRK